jgi:PTS system nitrogen regulatory IIA component
VDRIKVPLDSLNKPDALRELSGLLASAAGAREAEDEILGAILERESLLSTGVGGGIALPHGKCPVLSRLELVAGTTREPIDFEALDGQRVQLLIMLAGPASAAGLHVKTLARISRALRDDSLRAALIGSHGAVQFRNALRDAGV